MALAYYNRGNAKYELGDKIALIIWTDEPEGIIIENEAAAKAYRSYFEFMWGHANKKK